MIDPENPVVKLCIEITRAEFQGRLEDARRLSWQAWEASQDDHEACIAAHYVARFQKSPEQKLRWNQEALRRAEAASGEQVRDFYPSLYLNLGHTHELVGELSEARRYYDLAARLGVQHSK
jgi:hypothetical protein